MVKEIAVWCSPCFAGEVRAPAKSVAIALDGSGVKMLDVCEQHERELIAPLREWLDSMGESVTHDALICVICGKRYSSSESLRKHTVRKHSNSSESTSPSAQLVDVSEKTHECPDCGTRFETPQGCGAHRSRVHGYRSPKNAKADRAREAVSA